jgi:hypothetical protein
MGRYAIRFEVKDGTLEEAIRFYSNKREALRLASALAKRISNGDDVAVWVDDTKTDLGVKRFAIKH